MKKDLVMTVANVGNSWVVTGSPMSREEQLAHYRANKNGYPQPPVIAARSAVIGFNEQAEWRACAARRQPRGKSGVQAREGGA